MQTTTAKMLTVRQPWAWAVFSDQQPKNVENRTRETRYRGTLLIHAGQATDHEGFDLLDQLGIDRPYSLERGVILGSVELIDCVRDYDSPWADPESWHWVLANPKPAVRLIEVRGNLGLLNPPGDWHRAFTADDAPGSYGWSHIRVPQHAGELAGAF